MNNIHNSKEPPDFSLFLGGPLFQLLLRARLTSPALELLKRRIVFITLFAWLPLQLLSLVDGKAWGGVGLPFLYDLEMQARFLVALPLLIAAEFLVHKWLRPIVAQFVDNDVITAEVLPKFKEVIASAMKLRNSVAIELIMFCLIFVGGYYLWSLGSVTAKVGTSVETWYATAGNGAARLSAAGYWYIFVSLPLFQFILIRWYFRLFIWARFLWQSARLELNLIPTHPDRAAGLGFLGMSCPAFMPLLLAHGVLLAGLIANPIFFAGAKLSDFMMEILAVVAFLLLIALGPLLVFSPCLWRVKMTGLREYGIFASRYVNIFDLKWLRGGAAEDEPLVNSPDISSLADLGNAFQVIREMRPFPFGKYEVIQLVVITLIPIVPLVLTMIPLEELITKLFGAIF
jgi:hypothetical protein